MARPVTNSNLTLLREYGLRLYQPADGYRFSVDSLLLAEFATPGAREHLVDLGAGCGVISMIVASRFPETEISAIEIQEQLAGLCARNIEENGFDRRIRAIQGDFREAGDFFRAGSVDYIVSNPPYRTPVSGRISANAQEALARHEILMNLDDLLDAAAFLLRTGGRIAMVYPAERFAMLVWAMKKRDIEPKKARFVHPDGKRNARLFLLEGRRCGKEGMTLLPPLFLNSSE
jgi:tRNA1Val (adenine37-N6)-methyltransferase